jgi:hypothetical protein
VSECFREGEIFVEVLLEGGSRSWEVWIDPAVEQRKGGESDHQEGEQDPSPSAAEKSNASRAPSGLLPAHQCRVPPAILFGLYGTIVAWRGRDISDHFRLGAIRVETLPDGRGPTFRYKNGLVAATPRR